MRGGEDDLNDIGVAAEGSKWVSLWKRLEKDAQTHFSLATRLATVRPTAVWGSTTYGPYSSFLA